MVKKLVVTANYGNIEYKSEAVPYKPSSHDDQYDSCVSYIHKKMKESGKYEMKDAFKYSEEIARKSKR